MSLMGIGEFAELSWLSQRALRLYDELGLLPPARVDPGTGYRQPDGGLRQIMLFNVAERRTDMEWAVALLPAGK